MRKVPAIVLIVLLAGQGSIRSQNDSLKPASYKGQKIVLAGSAGLLTCGSLIFLNKAWYQQYSTGTFHFFNDNNEWLQMDKIGHAYSNYQMSDLMMSAFGRAGFTRKAQLLAGGIGFAYMSAIEVMDGYSRGWGFSWGDELSNTLGTSLAISQEALWKVQHFRLKFSYAESGLAKYRPDLLGDTPMTRLLKDYNGQTYWLSFNPFSFSKRRVCFFPQWLALSLGYSAYGMLGGVDNSVSPVDNNGNVIKLERQRRFFLSLDVDLTKIKTRSKILKKVCEGLNILKFPAPALELSGNKLKWHYIYY